MKICIIGAGISGLTTARILAEKSYYVEVFEKENKIGGNLVEDNIDGTIVHLHGPHIFHTNSDEIWNFVNRFSKFEHYLHKVNGFIKGKFIPIPFNFNAIEILFKKSQAELFQNKLISFFGFGKRISILQILNSSDSDLNYLGKFIYKYVFKGYSEKQWGIPISKIDSGVLSRVPINLSYDDRYFSDKYQGIPENGYLKMINNIANHRNISIQLKKDVNIKKISNSYDYIFVSAPIDEFFNFKFGELSYRSLKFQKIQPDLIPKPLNSVQTNFSNDFNFTRITRYGVTKNQTNIPIYIAEYSENFKLGENHRYYPITSKNTKKLNTKYQEFAKKNNVIPIGRLGRYQYLNMDQAIGSAISKTNEFLNEWCN